MVTVAGPLESVMRVAILGASGRVGRVLAARLPDATRLNRTDLDITDSDAVNRFDWSAFDVVINAAAFTCVDLAESKVGRNRALAVNESGPRNLARAACRYEYLLVQLSTDYVYPGTHIGEIAETAPAAPLNAYGSSKYAGELTAAAALRHYVVRTSWVLGTEGDFLRRMAELSRTTTGPVPIVADQVGRPTFADDLADGLVRLVDSGAPSGTYHLTNTGEPTTWADLARIAFESVGSDPGRVRNRSTDEFLRQFPRKARRPLNSVLAVRKIEGEAAVALAPWNERIQEHLR
jgi:dTDP-4-dehydrorhamnose reductase